MESFGTIVNSFQPLPIAEKLCILDVCRGRAKPLYVWYLTNFCLTETETKNLKHSLLTITLHLCAYLDTEKLEKSANFREACY